MYNTKLQTIHVQHWHTYMFKSPAGNGPRVPFTDSLPADTADCASPPPLRASGIAIWMPGFDIGEIPLGPEWLGLLVPGGDAPVP